MAIVMIRESMARAQSSQFRKMEKKLLIGLSRSSLKLSRNQRVTRISTYIDMKYVENILKFNSSVQASTDIYL